MITLERVKVLVMSSKVTVFDRKVRIGDVFNELLDHYRDCYSEIKYMREVEVSKCGIEHRLRHCVCELSKMHLIEMIFDAVARLEGLDIEIGGYERT